MVNAQRDIGIQRKVQVFLTCLSDGEHNQDLPLFSAIPGWQFVSGNARTTGTGGSFGNHILYPEKRRILVPGKIEEKILCLRSTYRPGQLRSSLFLEYCHRIQVIEGAKFENGLVDRTEKKTAEKHAA